MSTISKNAKQDTTHNVDLERELSVLIIQFLNDELNADEVRLKLKYLKERGGPVALIRQLEDEFDLITAARAELGKAIGATRARLDREIELSQSKAGADIGMDDDVVVSLTSITINWLFSDAGDVPGGKEKVQDIVTTLIVNGQENSVAFKRSRIDWPLPISYEKITNTESRALYVGKPRGILDLDFGVIESEEKEKELLTRIEELLKTASGFAGYVPVYGTAVGAGLSLGAAIAALIRSALQDDKELRFLGAIGGQGLPLKYGDYSLKRGKNLNEQDPFIDIDIRFSITKLERLDVTDRDITILLENAVFTPGTRPLNKGERILLDATMTGAPEKSNDNSEIRVAGIQVEQEYIDRERSVNMGNVLKVNEKLLYAGPWGANLAYSVSFSGFPLELFGKRELLDVLSQTSALVSSVVDPQKADDVRRGFEIAQSAASVVIKYAPERLFSISKTGILFEGSPVPALGDLVLYVNPSTPNVWQPNAIDLDLGNFGKLTLNLLTRVTGPKPDVPTLPAKLLDKQATNTESSPWTWRGGAGTIEAYGDWDGATITLQQSTDQATWTDRITLSSNQIKTFEFEAPNSFLRAKLQNAQTDTKLTCVLKRPSRDQLLAEIRLKP